MCVACDPTGESVLSRVVNWMIQTKPIYSVMKLGAMNAMKSTTQKAGIDWDGHVRRMAATPEVSTAQHNIATVTVQARHDCPSSTWQCSCPAWSD